MVNHLKRSQHGPRKNTATTTKPIFSAMHRRQKTPIFLGGGFGDAPDDGAGLWKQHILAAKHFCGLQLSFNLNQTFQRIFPSKYLSAFCNVEIKRKRKRERERDGERKIEREREMGKEKEREMEREKEKVRDRWRERERERSRARERERYGDCF